MALRLAAPAVLGLALLAGTAVAATSSGPGTRPPLLRELTVTLDALLARERPGGGWTFAHAPHRRVRPLTVPLRVAEWIAAPLGLARWDVVVLRSPGTPAAGLALLGGYRLTGRAPYLDAARRAGDLLVALQLRTGGWLSEMPAEGQRLPTWFAAGVRRCALDDDVTPGAIRFLLSLWDATGERRYRDAAERGLALLLRAQLPGGAWPLVWRPDWKRLVWRTWEDLPTLNDGATAQAITTLVSAARVLGRADYLAAARRGGDWLVGARHASPQAGWAQQYDATGRPAPARRYEHAALASWESRYALEALLELAVATEDRRYCAAVAEAARWLARSAIAPGCWARFYALGTNAPLYVDERGARVDTPLDAHRPYDWQGDFGIPALLARLGIADEAVRPAQATTERVPAAGDPEQFAAESARPAADPLPADGDPLLSGADPLPRIAGDPGPCTQPHRIPPDPRGAQDPRALIARAGRLLLTLEPPVRDPCAPGFGVRTAPACGPGGEER